MEVAQVGKEIESRILPQLNELGLAAFVLVGYLEDGDGKTHRVTLGSSGHNPAQADGLRGMQIMAQKWGAGQL